MARGYIYEIKTDPNWLGSMTESDFYDKCGIIADYFENANTESNVKDLLEWLEQYHITTGMEQTNNGNIPYFQITDDTKERYFEHKFNKVKQKLNNMSLTEFSRNTGSIYEIQQLIDNDYSDAVYCDDSFSTMDRFIREARTDIKYYIGNVVLMH